MLRQIGPIALLTSALCQPAQAGDVAELTVLGFSQDGGVFAFEEYGVQDGSGFPYANRFYIDTDTDAFLPGTPIRVRLDDEAASLAAARAEAAKRGEKIIAQHELDANRGFTAGFNAVTELTADPWRMTVNPRPVFPPIDAPLAFLLDELPMTDPGRCYDLGELKGFRLRRAAEHDGGAAAVLHEDKSVPASRGCATAYRLSGVQTFSSESLTAYAVLIAIASVGFEGPNYRWLAVTGRLP